MGTEGRPILFRFLFPILPVAIGLYLPLELSVTVMIGGVIRWILDRNLRKQGRMEGRGILFCSGMIAGERLADILQKTAYKRLMRTLVTPKQFKVEMASVSIKVDPKQADLLKTRSLLMAGAIC